MLPTEQLIAVTAVDAPMPSSVLAPALPQRDASGVQAQVRPQDLVWVKMEFAQLPAQPAELVIDTPQVEAAPAQAQILQRAAQGDVEAAFELGSAWRLCRGYVPDNHIDTRQLLAELQQPEIQPRLAEMKLSAEEVVELTRAHQDLQTSRCPQLMAVLDVMSLDDARAWLDLAAQAGRADALAELAAMDLQQLQGLRSQARNRPELLAQRDQHELSARDFVEQAMRRGDMEALALRARMRLGDNLSGASREARLLAYADLLAYEALRPASGHLHPHSSLLRQLAEGLDAAGLREAGEQAVLVGLELSAEPSSSSLANAP